MLENPVGQDGVEGVVLERQGVVGVDDVGLVELGIVEHFGIEVGADDSRDFALEDADRLAVGGRAGAQIEQDSLRRGLLADPAVEGDGAVASLVRIEAVKGGGRYH